MSPRDDGLLGVDKLDTDIKLIFNLAGNTLINQHSDINRTIELLRDTQKCEFIVCSDVFMTASARFADILLPASSFLEDENISCPWDFGDYLLFNNKVIDPPFECRFEYLFIEDLARRLGLWEAWSAGHGNSAEWLQTIYAGCREVKTELPPYEVFREEGGYHSQDLKPYVAYEEQIRDFAHHPFATPSGKIEIFSRRLYDLGRPGEVPAIPGYVSCPEGPDDPLTEQYPLQLIGWHTKRRTHSIHDNNPCLERAEPQRLWMNPLDAEHRGIADGDTVEIFNDRGQIRIPVLVTTRIIRGVVAMAQGAWYTPDASGTDMRGSINVLSSQRPTPLARGNPQHTNLVEVRKTACLRC
jgi:anaerobic dimethyl sulfoxide reductase subunit A